MISGFENERLRFSVPVFDWTAINVLPFRDHLRKRSQRGHRGEREHAEP